MNHYQFGQTGGFPLTQERLAFMQDSYIGAITALGKLSGATLPVVITGVEYATTNQPNDTVTDGWIYHPDKGIIPFIGGIFGGGNTKVAYITNVTPLTFANNSQQGVEIKDVAVLSNIGEGVGTLMQRRFMPAVGDANRTVWDDVSNEFGEIKYRKDNISRMAHVYGNFVIPYAASFQQLYFKQVFGAGTFLALPEPIAGRVMFPCLLWSGNNEYAFDAGRGNINSMVGKLEHIPSVGPASPINPLRFCVPQLRLELFVQGQPTPMYNVECNFSYHY